MIALVNQDFIHEKESYVEMQPFNINIHHQQSKMTSDQCAAPSKKPSNRDTAMSGTKAIAKATATLLSKFPGSALVSRQKVGKMSKFELFCHKTMIFTLKKHGKNQQN